MSKEEFGLDGKKRGEPLASVVGSRLLLRLFQRATASAVFICGLIVATAALAESEPIENDREKAVAFVNRLRLLIQHGDLADKAFVEKTMGGRLVLSRETAPDRRRYPNSDWEKGYVFDLEDLAFPVRSHKGSDYGFRIKISKKMSAYLDFHLQYQNKSTCVTHKDMADGFGVEDPFYVFGRSRHGKDSDPRMYVFNGKNKITTVVSGSKTDGCVSLIGMRQDS